VASRFSLLVKFEDGFGELHPGGPGFIDAGAGEDVGAAGAFPNPGVAIANEKRLAATARFLKRLGAPGAQASTLQMTPEVGMQNKVLEVTVGSPHGSAEPGRHKNSGGGDPLGMDV